MLLGGWKSAAGGAVIWNNLTKKRSARNENSIIGLADDTMSLFNKNKINYMTMWTNSSFIEEAIKIDSSPLRMYHVKSGGANVCKMNTLNDNVLETEWTLTMSAES